MVTSAGMFVNNDERHLARVSCQGPVALAHDLISAIRPHRLSLHTSAHQYGNQSTFKKVVEVLKVADIELIPIKLAIPGNLRDATFSYLLVSSLS